MTATLIFSISFAQPTFIFLARPTHLSFERQLPSKPKFDISILRSKSDSCMNLNILGHVVLSPQSIFLYYSPNLTVMGLARLTPITFERHISKPNLTQFILWSKGYLCPNLGILGHEIWVPHSLTISLSLTDPNMF